MTVLWANCTEDTTCRSVCVDAANPLSGAGLLCEAVTCNSFYQRCACRGDRAQALLHNGSCDEPVPPADRSCDEGPAYAVDLYIAAEPAPELNFLEHAVDVGNASAAVVSLLRRGVAAAVGAAPQQVALADLQLQSGGYLDGYLLFHALFAFCAPGLQQPPDWGLFLKRLRVELQRYAVFRASTVELLEYGAREIPTNFTNLTTASPGAGRPLPGASSGGDEGSVELVLAVVACVLIFLCVCAAIGVAVFWCCCVHPRRERAKVAAAEEAALLAAQIGAAYQELPADEPPKRVVAHVASPFSPEDVEDDKVFREACLKVDDGDIVEVIAGGGGWFYGRVVGAPERMGFFPENRASWVGAVPTRGTVATNEQHQVVTVDYNFAPSDLEPPRWTCADCDEPNRMSRTTCNGCSAARPEEWSVAVMASEQQRRALEALREDCLELQAGEVVNVLAGGGGWLYGEVVGAPERCGYFPENRVRALGECESQDDAARTEQGALMKVGVPFSPGCPGDDEEDVDFSESCIALAEGDVVEVIATGGGWLYGRVVGSPERVGYFPENRVTWVGQPVAEGGGADASTGAAADGSAAAASASVAAQGEPFVAGMAITAAQGEVAMLASPSLRAAAATQGDRPLDGPQEGDVA